VKWEKERMNGDGDGGWGTVRTGGGGGGDNWQNTCGCDLCVNESEVGFILTVCIICFFWSLPHSNWNLLLYRHGLWLFLN
jgi:hypothetical protein